MPYYVHIKGLTELKTPADAPEQPHFVIIYFDTLNYTSPGYDRGDPDEYHNVKTYKIYVTTDKALWQKAIQGFYAEDQHRKDILAYEVLRQAKAKITITIE